MGEHMHPVSTNPYLDMIRDCREAVSQLTPETLAELRAENPDFDHYVWLLDLVSKETS